jgi:hypothetical protein
MLFSCSQGSAAPPRKPDAPHLLQAKSAAISPFPFFAGGLQHSFRTRMIRFKVQDGNGFGLGSRTPIAALEKRGVEKNNNFQYNTIKE